MPSDDEFPIDKFFLNINDLFGNFNLGENTDANIFLSSPLLQLMLHRM
jgi:hypothetical protein